MSQKPFTFFDVLSRLWIKKTFLTTCYLCVAVLLLVLVRTNRAVEQPQKTEANDCCAQTRQIKNTNVPALVSQPAQIQILSQDQGLKLAQDGMGKRLTIEVKDVAQTANLQVVIDDSASQQQPLITRSVKGPVVTLNTLESGLSPGTIYYLSITPGPLNARFRLRQPATLTPLMGADLPNADYLQNAWRTTGRQWVADYTGVNWSAANKRWEIDPTWSHATTDIAQQAYFASYALRGATNRALVNHDLEMIDELAQFYIVDLKRFTTLGEMRRRKSAEISTDLLENQGGDSNRTLMWLEAGIEKSRMRESNLSTIQFLYPASRLIRIISTLPAAEQSPQMKQFVEAYWPLILREQLFRLVYEAHWDYWGARHLPKELINIWKTILQTSTRPKFSYQHGMFDRDLWMIAIAAELLGANANTPQLAPLSSDELARLREITDLGVQLFQKKRTLYPDTKDFNGNVVQSASYFKGDMDDHVDMAYADYKGEKFPTPADKNPPDGSSWDISHLQRMPIFLRALYDNKKATKLAFPQAKDIQLVVNQYVYVVFQGNYNRPLFNNYFDGRDGWYRVAYQGRMSAYPPSCACDTTTKPNLLPCLTSGSIQGWSLLTFFSDDLLKLQRSLVFLALADDAESVKFRKRYYTYDDQEFAFKNQKGNAAYPLLLFSVLSELPEQRG